ncbi:hypothetical protein AN640_03815 [Candidatus Epulonipiscium fishelsonii]|uniref:Uncharacterized protein n=1 Tax=Candidatus Epulonipiscium fishelsonii TaxID=77094 RepID=A0ACC8XIU5_9FIRM|nr:hypothetical protein AN640_03815 [Epulopiscium sp. SCG-D08WGA-EpuloA1]OON90574.1 MAG: hypothetical protein ATN32_03620 [Epulopiscium sp. AS2M-Bin002]
MTLKEIANKVGVSITTVSRVINKNDTKCASKEVRDRIWDVVSASEYTPNKEAQALRQTASGTKIKEFVKNKNIACFFARTPDVNSDPFFNYIYRSIEKEAFKLGYFIKCSLSFNQLNNSPTKELLLNSGLDGLIILGKCDNKHLKYLCNNFKNIIYISLAEAEAPIDQIICDGYKIARTAVNYLNFLGHTKIGYIGEQNDEIRYKGFCDELSSLNLDINPFFCINSNLSAECGYKAMQDLIKINILPTAIVCCNDLTAIGAIKASKDASIKVPQDISIMGIDDIEIASYIEPSLTTISVPKDEMGKIAAKLLFDKINNEYNLPIKIEFPYKLQIRQSCKNLN